CAGRRGGRRTVDRAGAPGASGARHRGRGGGHRDDDVAGDRRVGLVPLPSAIVSRPTWSAPSSVNQMFRSGPCRRRCMTVLVDGTLKNVTGTPERSPAGVVWMALSIRMM